MRMSICAQSHASVPPPPAWILRNALVASCGAAEHGAQLERFELLREAAELGCQFALEAAVLLAQLGERLEVLQPDMEIFVGIDQAIERLELLDDLLGPFGVVPEVRLTHQAGQLVALGPFARDVKDCPADG